MLNPSNSGLLIREVTADGMQSRQLVMPDRRELGSTVRSPTVRTSTMATPAPVVKVEVIAFDPVWRTTFGSVSGDDWRDIERNGLRDNFDAAMRHGLTVRSAVDHCSDIFLARSRGRAEPALPPPNAEVFRHGHDSVMVRLRDAIAERDVHGYPIVHDSRWGGGLRPAITVGEDLYVENGEGEVELLSQEATAEFVAASEYRARPPTRDAALTQAELFLAAWAEWDEEPRREIGFSDWCRARDLAGCGDGQFAYTANWHLRPDPQRLILDYAVMDFEDGSMAVRRNHTHHEGPAESRGEWMATAPSSLLQHTLLRDRTSDVVAQLDGRRADQEEVDLSM